MYEPRSDDDRATRGALAATLGGWATVASVMALIALHVPRVAEQPQGAPVVTAGASAPAEATAYYFPSDYQLHAPDDPGEPAPTF